MSLPIGERRRRGMEKIIIWLAWKMPRKLAYWCAVRVMANATVGQYSSQVVPELLALDGLKRWEEK